MENIETKTKISGDRSTIDFLVSGDYENALKEKEAVEAHSALVAEAETEARHQRLAEIAENNSDLSSDDVVAKEKYPNLSIKSARLAYQYGMPVDVTEEDASKKFSEGLEAFRNGGGDYMEAKAEEKVAKDKERLAVSFDMGNFATGQGVEVKR